MKSLLVLHASDMDQDHQAPQPVTTNDILLYFEEYPVPPWSVTAESIATTILQHLIGTNRTTCSYRDDEFLTPKKVRQTWSAYDRRNVINFMHASPPFARPGREILKELLHPSRVEQCCPFLELPEEIFTHISNLLSPTRQALLPLWKFRASLSVESFATPPPLLNLDHISEFRLTCQKFAWAGLKAQFRDVKIRFTAESFENLQHIARTKHTARKATRISYMVPRFYSKDSIQFEELLLSCIPASPNSPEDNGMHHRPNLQPIIAERYQDDIINAMKKAVAQKELIRQGLDRHSLLEALIKFRQLTQIRIMRCEDSVDKGWVSFLKHNPSYAGDLMTSEWVIASDHAVSTLRAAIVQSNSPAHRLSSRFIDPSIALVLFTLSHNENVSEWARQLTSLELQLVKDRDLNTEIAQLSPQFRALFKAAVNLEAFHVGSYHEVSVPLKAIFHGAHLRNLQHLGLHSWLLDCEELIDFLAQHQTTIRSLRLRSVILKRTSEEDPKWLQVLRFIRMNLTRINWISLREINYEGAPPDYAVPDTPPAARTIYDSQSETEDSNDSTVEIEPDTEDEDAQQSPAEIQSTNPAQDSDPTHDNSSPYQDVVDEDDEGSVEFERAQEMEQEIHSDVDDDHGKQRNRQHSTRCQCGNGSAWDDLVDNGVSVKRTQWKMWQVWTVNRCWMHDPSSNN